MELLLTKFPGYPGIAELRFNGTHNGMAKSKDLHSANGMKSMIGANKSNGAPIPGSHAVDVGA